MRWVTIGPRLCPERHRMAGHTGSGFGPERLAIRRFRPVARTALPLDGPRRAGYFRVSAVTARP